MKPLSIFIAVSTLLFTVSHSVVAGDAKPKPDADMQKVLNEFKALEPKAIAGISPDEARKQPTLGDAAKKILKDSGQSIKPEPGLSLKNINIPGPLGRIPSSVFTPDGKGPFPVIVYYHGGGFVIADTITYEASVRALAQGANAIVVSVDYHQAPEYKFPAAPNDAFAAYKWVLEHAKDFNGDSARVAVAGESAGGNLAAVVSLMARDQNVQLPTHQLLIYPVVNDDMNTASYQRNKYAVPLNKAAMQWFFKHYAGDAKSPYALPFKAESLKGLPSATVITAEIDPLLFEGKAYAERLKASGVAVDYKEYSGVTHEFFGLGAVVAKAKAAETLAVANLKKAFAK